MANHLFTTRKFDGDDQHSWAVFRKEEVKGKRGIITWSDRVRPIVTGLGREEASRLADRLARETENKSSK